MAQLSVDLPGVTDPEILYHYRLGVFHGVWATVDILSDYAVGKFLNVDPIEAHMITWGMMFGPKAKLLGTLIKRSGHTNKQALLTALNSIRNDAKRDVLAHGYQLNGDDEIAFIERPRGSDFKPRLHVFTRDGFGRHVDKLIGDANAFQVALAPPEGEVEAFVAALRSLEKRA